MHRRIALSASTVGVARKRRRADVSRHPPPSTHNEIFLKVAILRRAHEAQLGRRRRDAWRRIVARSLTVRCRDKTDRAFGIIPPAVRIGIFLTGVMQATHLIFQAGAIALLEDCRRDEDQQVSFRPRVRRVLKEITEDWDIPHHGHLVRDLATSSCSNPPIARVSPLLIRTFESRVRVSIIGLDTAAPAKTKVASPTLLLISGFTLRVMKLSLLTDGLNDQRVAKFLVLESAEDRRRCLFVEVQLRHRLIADDFNLRLLIVGRDDARIREKLSVGIFVQRAHRDRHLRHRKNGKLSKRQVSRGCRRSCYYWRCRAAKSPTGIDVSAG